jgi:hypothetical protein
MTIDQEMRIQALNSAEPTVREAYAAEHWKRTYPMLIEKYNIADEDPFIDLIGDYILGLVDESAFIQSLKQHFKVDEKLGNGLIKEIESFSNKTTSEISVIDSKAVTPIQTMAGDIEKIHGYGAVPNTAPTEPENEPVYRTEQETVLKPKPVTDTPTYTVHTDQSPPAAVTPAVTSEPEDTRWTAETESENPTGQQTPPTA